MSRLLLLLTLGGATSSGCLSCIPSMASCPAPGDVERSYQLDTSCAGGASLHLRVHDLVVDRMNDCPAGCFATARAPVDVLDGGLPVQIHYFSSCGTDPGNLVVQFFPDGYCEAPLDHLGEDLACSWPPDGGACTLRLSAAN